MTDRWFTLTAPSVAVRKDGRAMPGSTAVVRIKVNFRSINILPVRCYKPLIEVRCLCRMLLLSAYLAGSVLIKQFSGIMILETQYKGMKSIASLSLGVSWSIRKGQCPVSDILWLV